MKARSFIKQHIIVIAVCTLFAAVCLCLLPWYQHGLNSDALAYFGIAKKYVTGAFKAAINDYWGPLFSILLVPAVWAGVDLITASKILIISLSILVIITSYVLLIRREDTPLVAGLGAFVLAILLVAWGTYEAITPDVARK